MVGWVVRKSFELPISRRSMERERAAVRDRIDLNTNLPPVAMPGRLFNELCSHALDAMPEECCGLITGRRDQPFQNVCRIPNVMNKMHLSDPINYPRDARFGYYMAESEYLRAQVDAENRGETVTGVYHSHVDVGAYLSSDDLVYAENPLFPFPGAFQIVLGVTGGRIEEVALFGVDPATGEFPPDAGRLIEVTEA